MDEPPQLLCEDGALPYGCAAGSHVRKGRRLRNQDLMTLPIPVPAPYRSRPETSCRFIAEPQSPTRTAFQRDRDRIIHASAFRRLALKTQVFLPEEGDHYRTRLTHTIEVAQITRTLTRALGLDDDLGEALALAHDLGHTPFGHTGEDALDSVMRPFGGFDHNAQTLRIVCFLERRYPAFPGLNLTWDTLEGLLNRGGHKPWSDTAQAWFFMGLPCFGDDGWRKHLNLAAQPAGEAQAAALADDIAYNAHDLEDGLQAGLFDLGDLDAVPLLRSTRDALLSANDDGDEDLLIRGLARELVGLFVEGAIAESRARLDAARPETAADIRKAGRPLLALPDELATASDGIKAFLFTRMYRHPRLIETRQQARHIVTELADGLLADPDRLPLKWRQQNGPMPSGSGHARRVADYVASMTDRFATAEHRRIFDPTGELG